MTELLVTHGSCKSLRLISAGLTGQPIIPGGMGVANKEGEHIGIITLGINIFKLRKKLREQLAARKKSYIVLDKSGNELVSIGHDYKYEHLKKDFESSGGIFTSATPVFGDRNEQFSYSTISKRGDFRIISFYDRKIAFDEMFRLIYPRLIEFFGIGAFLLFILYLVHRNIVSPVVQLSNVAGSYEGEENINLPKSKTKEIEEISNQMRFLTEQMRMKKKLVAEIDLLSREKQHAELISKNQAEMIHGLSHELRTPLNAILGFSEMIREEIYGPVQNPKYRDYIKHVHRSAQHLLSLVNDLLDLAKIEAGVFDLHESSGVSERGYTKHYKSC